MTSTFPHALQTIIFVLATGAQAESIPRRERMTQSHQVAMEVEAEGMDDQYSTHESQPATSRIIRSWDSVRKQPTDVDLGEPVLQAGSPCTNTKGTCHSMCAKTVSGHTYKRPWCYTTAFPKANTKKWCFCAAGGGDDESPEQVIQGRGSAIPVENVASEQPAEPPQVNTGTNDELVKQLKTMSAKIEGLQSIVDHRLEKMDERMKQIDDVAAAAAAPAAAAGKVAAKDEDIDGSKSANETNSTKGSNETDTDDKVRKKGSVGGFLFIVFLCCCIMPAFGVFSGTDVNKAPTPSPPAQEVPPEQQESVTNPGDEQALSEQAADPAAPPSEETLAPQRQSVVQ